MCVKGEHRLFLLFPFREVIEKPAVHTQLFFGNKDCGILCIIKIDLFYICIDFIYMTITQLEYLVAVDTYRSFVTAAAHCFVTQPTLSMQLQKLEEEFGVKLFDRERQPVVPTDIGVEVIRQARIALTECARIPEIVQQQQQNMTGSLRLGVIPTLAPYLLPLFLPGFIERYPGVSLIVTELTTEEIIQRLRNGELDCGLLATPLHEKGLLENPLFYEPFVAYVSDKSALYRKSALRATELQPEELWILQEGHCFRNQVLNFCHIKPSGKYANLHYESGSLETLKRLVEAGRGVTVLPGLALREMTAAQMKRIRYFRSPEPVREVALVTHRYFVKERLLEALAVAVKEAVPEKMRVRNRKNAVLEI